MIIEKGEKCSCGGEIDLLYTIGHELDSGQGRCFVCGERYTVLSRSKRLGNIDGKIDEG